MKWNENPDYVKKTLWKPIHEIPFPAVTVCSPLFARDNLANLNEFYLESKFHGEV